MAFVLEFKYFSTAWIPCIFSVHSFVDGCFSCFYFQILTDDALNVTRISLFKSSDYPDRELFLLYGRFYSEVSCGITTLFLKMLQQPACSAKYRSARLICRTLRKIIHRKFSLKTVFFAVWCFTCFQRKTNDQ